MKGIVLLSHGSLAQGMYETAKWFMGDEIDQFDYLCLEPNEKAEEFDSRIQGKIKEVDQGDGVILFVDLLGGTPCNRCMTLAAENVQIISGMNLTLVLEQLGGRLSDQNDFDYLVQVGRDGICDINKFVSESEVN